jgi:hypothetical protein
MPRLEHPQERRAARASALVRLCAAREELWRQQARHAGAAGTAGEEATRADLAAAAAALATREEWLHWIDRGTSVHPEADGEWGLPPRAPEPAEPPADRGTGAARRRPSGVSRRASAPMRFVR